MDELEETPTFPLLELPYLSLKDTVKQMDEMDILKFSKSSQIPENLVKFMNFKIEGIMVYTNFYWSRISFLTNGSGYRTPEQYFYTKEEDIHADYPEEPPKENHIVPDYLEGCLKMSEEVKKLFRMKTCSFTLLMLQKEPEEMIEILSRMLANGCSSICIVASLFVEGQNSIEQVIDGKVLDYLMESMEFDGQLILNGLFPEDYYHKSLFKFRDFIHNNASWVTMEMLKSLRNAGSFTFFSLNFTSEDINNFIHFWMNCEEDMMENIEIDIKQDNNFIEADVLDQLVTLDYFDSKQNRSYRLIKARKTNNRTHILASISFSAHSKGITLKIVDHKEQFKVQLEILELLERENQLEKELAEIEQDEKRIINDLPDDNEELTERKQLIRLELAEIRKELLLLH